MLYFLWAITFFGTAFCMIQFPNSYKHKKFMLYILFIFIFILHGWSNGAYDVDIGISRYVNYKFYQSFTEIGFNYLVRLGHYLGMEYRTFYVLVSLFELIVIFWFVDKNCSKSPIVMGLFILYPSIILLQYIRNLVALPFILIGIDALINKSKSYMIKYVVFVLIASTFHLSTLFFLLYLPASFFQKKYIAIASIAGVFVLKAVSNLNFLYKFVERYVGSSKADILSRTANAADNFGRIVSLSFAIAIFYFMYYFLKVIFKVEMDEEKDRLFFNMNAVLLLCIPLTQSFAVGFSRIPTLIYIVNYVFYVNKISTIDGQKKRVLCYCVLGLFLLGLLVMSFRNLEYRQLVLYPFFEQNEFINWLF